MIASFYFLAQALKSIPVGTGYAIWTGIGAAGTAILGIILFLEPAFPSRLVCIALIVGHHRTEIDLDVTGELISH